MSLRPNCPSNTPISLRYIPSWEIRCSPGCSDRPFWNLLTSGHFQVSHFLVVGHWPSLSTLTDPNGTFQLDFWRALQLRNFFNSLLPPGSFNRPLTTFEESCSDTGVLPHALSTNYITLITPPPHSYRLPGLTGWEQDINRKFTPTKDITSCDSHTNPQFALKRKKLI